MSLRDDLLRANAEYAASFAHGHLSRPPAKRIAVVTCIDGRIEPQAMLGLGPGDANVLRNAGALVTDDVLRSLVVSRWLLGMRETLVVAHTDCGLAGISEADAHARLRAEGVDASAIELGAFADLDESVRRGVRKIAESPLLEGVEASGWVYDVRTGRLREVT